MCLSGAAFVTWLCVVVVVVTDYDDDDDAPFERKTGWKNKYDTLSHSLSFWRKMSFVGLSGFWFLNPCWGSSQCFLHAVCVTVRREDCVRIVGGGGDHTKVIIIIVER